MVKSCPPFNKWIIYGHENGTILCGFRLTRLTEQLELTHAPAKEMHVCKLHGVRKLKQHQRRQLVCLEGVSGLLGNMLVSMNHWATNCVRDSCFLNKHTQLIYQTRDGQQYLTLISMGSRWAIFSASYINIARIHAIFYNVAGNIQPTKIQMYYCIKAI